MKYIATIVLMILGFGMLEMMEAQNTYYVSTTGNNASNGSFNAPWKTIQFGVQQLSPGDVLNIFGGVYEEKINIDVSGTSGNYITIQNYQNENVVIDAINSPNPYPILWTDNAYLRIEGLHLTNNIQNYAEGLAIRGAAHHIEILNNKVSNIKFDADPNAPVNFITNAVPFGVLGNLATDSVHNILIKGNEIFNNQTGYSENLTLGGNVSGFIVEENIVHDNTNIGIDVTGNYGQSPNPIYDNGRNGIIRNNIVYNCFADYSAGAGIYVDGGKNLVIENNISHHNGYGGEIGCEESGETRNVVFRNNIFYQNAYAGMQVGAYDSNTQSNVVDCYVLYNTFYQNDTQNSYAGELNLSKLEDCAIENNIFYVSNQNVLLYAYRTQTNFSFNYNLIYADAGITEVEAQDESGFYYGLQNFYNGTGYGANSTFGNPYFANATALVPDFHIAGNSPAIDAGNPAYIADPDEVDMDFENRIDNTIDCGADEFYVGTSITDVHIYVSPMDIAIYPNPFNDKIVVNGDFANYEIEVLDSNGQTVTDYTGTATPLTIDLNALGNGLYFLSIRHLTNTALSICKIIKE